jgi:hypothetical protein
MGIFLIMAGTLLGFGSLMTFAVANGLPQEIFAGEIAICGALLFVGGAIILAINNLERVLAPAKAAPKVDEKAI